MAMWVGLLLCLVLGVVGRLWAIRPRRWYAISGHISPGRPRRSARLGVVLGSGGHTTEMLRLLKALRSPSRALEPFPFDQCVYLVTQGDRTSLGQLTAFECTTPIPDRRLEPPGPGSESAAPAYQVITVPRSRTVGQSWWTTPWSALQTLLGSVAALYPRPPDILVCNGPGSCVPIVLVCYALFFLGLAMPRIIYIESFARVKTLSLTGRLLYPLVHRFIVQWPQLAEKYPRAEYHGMLV